jgi:hypothetical protein
VFNEASVARLHTHSDAQVYGFGHFILRHRIADNMLDLRSRLPTDRTLDRVVDRVAWPSTQRASSCSRSRRSTPTPSDSSEERCWSARTSGDDCPPTPLKAAPTWWIGSRTGCCPVRHPDRMRHIA